MPGIAVDSLPKVRVEHGARARIRAGNAERRSVVVALDDDPTGSQTVHGVDIVTVLDPAEFASALDGAVADGRVDAGTAEFFVLTNTRSVSEARASPRIARSPASCCASRMSAGWRSSW